jgi:GTPase
VGWKIERELRKYDPAMLDKPRWLVLNKADLMFEDEARALAERIIAELEWTQPWFLVSALSREGTWPIMLEIQRFFDELREAQLEADAEAAAAGKNDAG